MGKKQDDFIALVVPGAQQVQKEIGMFASVTIAQAAWETGWGTSTPKDIQTGEESYNLFGRKAAGDDPYVESWTWEVYNGNRETILARFKKFDSYEASILDRSQFLTLPWYQRACKADNPWDAARFLIDTGYPGYSYATDPTYIANIHSIMKSYDLTQYDILPQEESDIMELTNEQWNHLYKVFDGLYDQMVNKGNPAGLSSWDWAKKVAERNLTVSEAVYLSLVLHGRDEGVEGV